MMTATKEQLFAEAAELIARGEIGRARALPDHLGYEGRAWLTREIARVERLHRAAATATCPLARAALRGGA